MKDSSSPPPAPDPAVTAGAQSQSNIQTAIANARLNRVNQQTPFGSITYTAGTPDANGVPTYSSQIQLSPEQQALLDQQQQTQLARGSLAQQYLSQITGQPLDLSHLHPLNIRGQQYTGAVNAAPSAAPAGNSGIAALLASMQPGSSGTSPGVAPGPSTNPGATPTPGAPATPNTPTAPPTAPPNAPTTSLGPTYQDYVASAGPQNNGGSEGGQGTSSLLTEQQWNALSDTDKWNTLTGGYTVPQNDPRFQALFSQLGGQGDPGRGVRVLDNNPGNMLVNPGQTVNQGNATAFLPENQSPQMEALQNAGGMSDKQWALAVLSLFGGAIAAGGGLGAAAADGSAGADAGSAGAFDAGGSTGFGGSTALDPSLVDTSSTGAFDQFGSNGLGGSTAQAPSMWQQAQANFLNGRGLLGLNPVQRAGVGLLPQILRGLQGQNSGGTGR